MNVGLLRELKQLRLREKPARRELYAYIRDIPAFSSEAAQTCRDRWNRLCKPLYALGELEQLLVQLAGVQGTASPEIRPAAVFAFCADNGIVAEGVSQCGQEVTAQVLRNMAEGKSTVTIFAKKLEVDFFPFDLGVAEYCEKADGVIGRKVMERGTRSFLKEAAMNEQEMLQALFFGLDAAELAAGHGIRLLAGGEMGIGNTSSSTALAAALLGEDAAALTGRGAGLCDEAFLHKQEVIREALQRRREEIQDPLDALKAVGGLDLAALCGMMIGAAKHRIPVLLDGLITYAAALAAVRIDESCRYHLLPTHKPREKAGAKIASALGLRPVLDLDIALGEGAGSLLLLPLLDLALSEWTEMPCFDEGKVERYEDYLHP